MVAHSDIDHTGITGVSGNVAADSIWDAAGDLAVGSGANTAARLAIGAAGGALSRVNGAVAWNSGTSFPTAATGDRYWRTDLGMEFYYDGTRWLSTTLFQVNFAGVALTATGVYYIPLRSAYDIYVVDLVSSTFVDTTNDGSKYWTLALKTITAGNTSADIGTHNTSADSASTWAPKATSVGTAVATSSYKALSVTATKTSTAGALYHGTYVTFRRIAA